MRKLWIVFGVIVVIIIAVIVFFRLKGGEVASTMLTKSFVRIEERIIANLPENFSEDEVRLTFDNAIENINEKKGNPDKLKKFIMLYTNAFRDGKLDSVEVAQLLSTLKEATQPGN